MPAPELPPYYNQGFISEILEAVDDGMSVEKMSSRQWYNFFTNKNVLEEKIETDGEILVMPVQCKSEQEYPDLNWDQIWKHARNKGSQTAPHNVNDTNPQQPNRRHDYY